MEINLKEKLREKILRDAREDAKRIYSEAKREADEIIKEMRKGAKDAQSLEAHRQKIKKGLGQVEDKLKSIFKAEYSCPFNNVTSWASASSTALNIALPLNTMTYLYCLKKLSVSEEVSTDALPTRIFDSSKDSLTVQTPFSTVATLVFLNSDD